jgi:hypothetical protein
MNIADLPILHENDIERLKRQLASACVSQHIDKFESDDIIELLEDGESVDWIIDQLKSDSPSLDVAQMTILLTDIRALVAPVPAEESADEPLDETTPVEDHAPSASEPIDASAIDFSQIDMTQLGDVLPEGMKLPKGVNLQQLQKLMESPQGKFLTDFTLFCHELGIDMASLNDQQQMMELDAKWKQTPRPAFGGKTPAEMLAADPSLVPQKVETYRRDEPRVGRNDPCPCGSGKKYKKCCG